MTLGLFSILKYKMFLIYDTFLFFKKDVHLLICLLPKLMDFHFIQCYNPLWPRPDMATWGKELTHLKRPWCWERLRAGGEGDEMVGWHHQLNGHGFGWTPAVSDGQGGLACWGSWGRKESDTTERLNWTDYENSPLH